MESKDLTKKTAHDNLNVQDGGRNTQSWNLASTKAEEKRRRKQDNTKIERRTSENMLKRFAK